MLQEQKVARRDIAVRFRRLPNQTKYAMFSANGHATFLTSYDSHIFIGR